MNERQLARLRRLADWLHERERKFPFELIVPATEAQLARVHGDSDRYDAELRPELMRRAIETNQNAGVEVEIWKIEVACVLLGRGARLRRSSTGSSRPRRSKGSSASRSGARSGGTRSRRSSMASSSARPQRHRSPTTTCTSCGLRKRQTSLSAAPRARLHNARRDSVVGSARWR
jgi:hypothetical protein